MRVLSGAPVAAAATVLGAKPAEELAFVRPQVLRWLQDSRIAFAQEVAFDLLDGSGGVLARGVFDIVYRDPSSDTGRLVIVETKGVDVDDLTPPQRVYVPRLESSTGGRVRFRSSKTGGLALPHGSVMTITGEHYRRVGRHQLVAFANDLAQSTGQPPFRYAWWDPEGGYRMFRSQLEYEGFLRHTKRMSLQPPPPRRGATPMTAIARGARATVAPGVLGTAVELWAAGEDIERESAALGMAAGANLRRLHQLQHPDLVPLRDGQYLFSTASGDLFEVVSDPLADEAYNSLRLIETLATPALPAELRLHVRDWWHSEVTGLTVFRDERGSWRLERHEEQGLVDAVLEQLRVLGIEVSHWF